MTMEPGLPYGLETVCFEDSELLVRLLCMGLEKGASIGKIIMLNCEVPFRLIMNREAHCSVNLLVAIVSPRLYTLATQIGARSPPCTIPLLAYNSAKIYASQGLIVNSTNTTYLVEGSSRGGPSDLRSSSRVYAPSPNTWPRSICRQLGSLQTSIYQQGPPSFSAVAQRSSVLRSRPHTLKLVTTGVLDPVMSESVQRGRNITVISRVFVFFRNII